MPSQPARVVFCKKVLSAGADILAGELSSQISSQCPNKEFEHGGQLFSLELRTISGDVDLPQHHFKTSDFNPQGKWWRILSHETLNI